MSVGIDRVVNQSRYGYRFAFNPVHTLTSHLTKLPDSLTRFFINSKPKPFSPIAERVTKPAECRLADGRAWGWRWRRR